MEVQKPELSRQARFTAARARGSRTVSYLRMAPAAPPLAPDARTSLKGRWRRVFYAMRTEGEGREPASIGVGLFIGCLPLFGLHLALVIVIGKLLRLNRLQMYLAANISNPFVAPLLLFVEAQVGAWIRRDEIHHFTIESLRSTSLSTVGLDLAVGSLVVGAVLGTGAALLTQLSSRANRGSNPAFEAVAREAAGRYLNFSITAWEVARAKLGADPVYRAALLGGLLPAGASVLDVGCGRGLMLSLLAEVKRRVEIDPTGARDLPRLTSLIGIEPRPRVAAIAQRALGDDATIVVSDVRTAAIGHVGAVLVFDVLHMMGHDDQVSVARLLAETLEPDGVMLVREVDAAGGWRFTVVRLGNRLQALLGGRWRQPLCFRSADEWRRVFGEMGLQATIASLPQDSPFANVLFVLRRRSLSGLQIRADAHELTGGRA
jgi:SAM-dependent methyltransferase